MSLCFVLVLEAIVAVLTRVLLFHFMRAVFGVRVENHHVNVNLAWSLPEIIWIVKFLRLLWTTITDIKSAHF